MAPLVNRSGRPDWSIDQDWAGYAKEEHGIWRTLFARQAKLLRNRAAPEFLDGVARLGIAGASAPGADGIPDFRRLNDVLGKATGFQIVAVPGLVPDDVFFEHLAHRRFPSTCFIRTKDQLDYIEEPDVFHDIFGHVPLLVNPVFADYMESYGKGGLKALKQGALHQLSRLYWYTVEFGLIATHDGLRIYGSGIVSSKGESEYSLDHPGPNRLGFDLLRIMRTKYRIDAFQETYFVIDSFEQLFDATLADFTPYYAELAALPELEAGAVLPADRVIHRGVGKKRRGITKKPVTA
jgi:phenylalanine-4-hydroxylase